MMASRGVAPPRRGAHRPRPGARARLDRDWPPVAWWPWRLRRCPRPPGVASPDVGAGRGSRAARRRRSTPVVTAGPPTGAGPPRAARPRGQRAPVSSGGAAASGSPGPRSQPAARAQATCAGRLHPLRRHRQPQRRGRARRCAATIARAARVGPQAADEGAVDLQRVHREAPEVGQRGVAGAEVVDRQPHPQRLQRRQRATAAAASPIATPSVISSRSRRAGQPPPRSAAATAPTSSGSWNSRAREVDRHRQRRPVAARPATPAPGGRPRRSTQRPSGTISPVSSASGMKSPGGTRPRAGCRQRTSASTSTTAPVARSTIGW